MKRAFSILTVITIMSSSLNVNAFGRASDCARMARGATIAFAEASGEDPNGDNFEFYLAIYETMYETCLEN